ncbi:MAG: XdhC family protein [Verrucomicrobiota bacterium]|nr:XdhC family protein [Verrucomicrobiota bacterium]
MNDFASLLAEWQRRRGQDLALATLVRAHGSSYRRPGARMLVTADLTTFGTVSAGCLEQEVAAAATEVMTLRLPCVMHFDTRRRFGCNGSIEIFVEPISEDVLATLSARLSARRECILETKFDGSFDLGTRVIDSADCAGLGSFVQTVAPPLRLIVIGDGPDAVALRAQAILLGWECECIESVATWRHEIDAHTAAVIATHNYGRDCAALRHLLPIGLRYLGVIGPRRRRDELLVDVLDSGALMTSNLFAPAGLHLGAELPAEIALSIVAEIQSVFAHATCVPLRDRKAPVHAEAAAAGRAEECARSAP